MATEAPSWADQWGAGGFGAMVEEEDTKAKKENEKKADRKGGFGKTVMKIKTGASNGFKWVKNQCQRKKKPSK